MQELTPDDFDELLAEESIAPRGDFAANMRAMATAAGMFNPKLSCEIITGLMGTKSGPQTTEQRQANLDAWVDAINGAQSV